MLAGTITSRLSSIYTGTIHKAFVAFILWVVLILSPIAIGMFALFVLVAFDLIVGIWKAIKQSTFSAARLRTGISKFILYPMAIVSVRIGETQIPHLETHFVSEFVILFLSVTELISILETLSILGINIPSPVLEFFKKQTDMKTLIKK